MAERTRQAVLGGALLVAAGASCAQCAPPLSPALQPLYAVRDGVITDRERLVLLLRGINVHEDSKYDDDHLIPLAPQEVELLLDSGFNSVRLLTFWEQVMPRPDALDMGYLGRFADEVDKLAAAGLYVVIDMHQDLWGDPFGEGAPAWACPEEIKAGYEADSPWYVNYFSSQVSGCFDRLWADEALWAQYARAWQAVAEAVCHSDAVIGFDLMNEPWPGTNLGVDHFDAVVLYRFYQQTADAIDAVCPGRLHFIEPSRAYDFGLVDPIEIHEADRRRFVLAPHFYPIAVHDPGAGYDGDAQALRDMWLHLYQVFLDAGVPLWFGEFGGVTGNANFDLYLEHIYSLFFEHGAGSALWAYSLDESGYGLADPSGARKPVFDSVCGVPVPTLLPSEPTRVTLDFDARTTAVEVSCVQGRHVEARLPGVDPWGLTWEPEAALEEAEVGTRKARARCRDDRDVELLIAPD